MGPEDNIQLPIIAVNIITTHILMSVEFQNSFSNKLDQLRKSTAQDNQLTRLSHHINTGFSCDKKNLPTDLHAFWPHRETLSVESRLITCSNRIIVPREMRPEMLQYIHREFYIPPRPSTAMTQEKFLYMHKVPPEQKEVCILSRPMLPDCGTPPLQPMANCSIGSPLQLITQCTPREKDLPQLPSTLGAQKMYQTQQELMKRQGNKTEKSYIELTPGTPVWDQCRQNTTWETAMVVSQCTTNSYWIIQSSQKYTGETDLC